MKHRKVTYTNSNQETVVFSRFSPYPLQYIHGLVDLDVENQRQRSAYQDGATKVESLIMERDLGIEFGYVGNEDEISQKRRYLSKVFNPKLTPGVLRYEDFDGETFEIEVEVHTPPTAPNRNARGVQTSLVQLEAMNPHWRSPQQQTEPLNAFVGMWEFATEFPMEFGEQGSSATIYNDGHVPCPVEIEFNGPAANPVITNTTTGEFIRVNQELLQGEKLYINTAFGNKRVEVIREDGTRENAYHYIDIFESTLFWLEVGGNEIEYSADSGADNAVVTVGYRKHYVGV